MPDLTPVDPASQERREPSLSRRKLIERLMFGTGRVRRYTQDSPVLPDVWLEYGGVADQDDDWGAEEAAISEAHKLLITPFRDMGAGAVRKAIVDRLRGSKKRTARVAYNQTTVAATLSFDDLIRVVLPMTQWWATLERQFPMSRLSRGNMPQELAKAVADPEHAKPVKVRSSGSTTVRLAPALLWTIRVAGVLSLLQRDEPLPQGFVGRRAVLDATPIDWQRVVRAFLDLIEGVKAGDSDSRIYSVSRNRLATPAIARSTLAVKADAARRLFHISCADLTWAIIDSGVDATHPAFRVRENDRPARRAFRDARGRAANNTRVVATYDFSEIDTLLDPETNALPSLLADRLARNEDGLQEAVADLKRALKSGRTLDWRTIEPLLRVPHEDGKYAAPAMDHGTHVAGILAGDWRAAETAGLLEEDLTGVCPDLRIYDLRVLNADGRGDEFSIMAALQFVRFLNSTNDYVVVHGANLSLSLRHDIANYACGRTPVCDECERVVSSGIVVVAAAGNQGYRKYATVEGLTTEAYNSISITDPGNADLVITVGATHRYRPHTYGVSYFSSRGPTGDGRTKPDLVAPGEKITAPLPGESYGSKDGTSMAAPHVSGAAALLIARHRELVGQPERIKHILCSTTTNLGRERYFQGSGMLDVLRALQAI